MGIKKYIGETTGYGKKREVALLGFMERKGSGMGKILNPIKNLPYFTERLLPKFFSDREQFTITFPNMIGIWQEMHPGTELNRVEDTDDTQGDTQGDTTPTSTPTRKGNIRKLVRVLGMNDYQMYKRENS